MICLGASLIESGIVTTGTGKFQADSITLKNLYQELLTQGILPNELNEFKRMSDKSKRAVLAAALACYESFQPTVDGSRVAMLSADYNCCLTENQQYFSDYISFGRVMGRGNLFVNTLPTTPLAEISLALSFTGPLYFIASFERPLFLLMEESCSLLESGEAEQVITLLAKKEATAVALWGNGLYPDGLSVDSYRQKIAEILSLRSPSTQPL